jgi:hypothetical protein
VQNTGRSTPTSTRSGVRRKTRLRRRRGRRTLISRRSRGGRRRKGDESVAGLGETGSMYSDVGCCAWLSVLLCTAVYPFFVECVEEKGGGKQLQLVEYCFACLHTSPGSLNTVKLPCAVVAGANVRGERDDVPSLAIFDEEKDEVAFLEELFGWLEQCRSRYGVLSAAFWLILRRTTRVVIASPPRIASSASTCCSRRLTLACTPSLYSAPQTVISPAVLSFPVPSTTGASSISSSTCRRLPRPRNDLGWRCELARTLPYPLVALR